jgi:hypothetical protein
MKIQDRDIQVAVSLAYKELRSLGDVLQSPLRDKDVELLRDEALKIIKAYLLTSSKYEQWEKQQLK